MSTAHTLPIAGDLEATWNFIEPGLEFILGAQGEDGVTSKMYMNCYTAVYNYCTNKSRSGNTSSLSSRAGSEKTTYSLTGAEIYYKLEEYLIGFIKNLQANAGESFLEFYVRKWIRFTIGAGYMNNVFDYMNRYWVQKERSDGRRDVFDVNTLALLQWKQYMFNTNVEQIRAQIFELIERQRNNEIVDTSVISVAIKSMVFLGIDVNDLKKPNMVVYASCFESFFIEKTTEYYRKESESFLSQHSVVDYMIKCENRLAEEISRSNNYLEERSKRYLLDTMHNVLIKDHAQEMYDQFLELLQQTEIEHISRMYKLLSKAPTTLPRLADILESFIKQEAAQAIEELKASFETPDPNAPERQTKRAAQNAINPKSYIHTLISIYEKFNDVVFNSFKKDPLFIKALDSACRHFVNINVIATPTPKSPSKSPDLLARYADSFLKATSKDADTEDMTAENLILVLKYIEDKDVFENHYRRLLAKRLINSNTKSDELEEGILQKLQEGNSLEFTSKITKMFQDMKSSEDLKAIVSDIIGFDNAVGDFNPLILAQNMWPFVHNEDYNLNIAPELQNTINVVETEYSKKHSGRNLQWLWNHGKNEVKANLSRKGKPPFIFTVSNVQLMILLAFNKDATLSYQQLLKTVGVSRNVLDAHLSPFVKFKLLDQNPPAPAQMGDSGTSFTIVAEYKSKKLKVNFVSSIRNEQKQEEDETSREIEESRKNYLTASIVRIMKARKTMKHNELVNEVLLQANSRFKAKLIDSKRAIEYLLDKEYIARRDGDMFEYLA